MTDGTVIRPATAADRPFLDSLDDRLIGEAAVAGIPAANLVAFQAGYTAAALDAAKPGAATLIATDGAGRKLGYVHLEPQQDILAGETAGYVSILAVTKDAEGRGVARRLMQAAEAWAVTCGYRFLLLDVFASNATARQFYAGGGFIEESLRLRRPL
jgi:GNAT superfamily N-acetyltransferase